MWMYVLLTGLAMADTPTAATETLQLSSDVSSIRSHGARGAAQVPATRYVRSQAVDAAVPDVPPSPCVTNPVLRNPSMDQVNFGDEASVRGEKSVAASHYKAAITVDRCNAYAWAGLGDVLLGTGSTGSAVRALEATTSLMPHHFRAWTQLGEAREAMGMVDEAIEAYQEALVLRQDYVPAQDGLRRASRR